MACSTGLNVVTVRFFNMFYAVSTYLSLALSIAIRIVSHFVSIMRSGRSDRVGVRRGQY
jgi:hypothetical protein